MNNMICSLDYLVGTLATAYKGVITSLVAKDFCIWESDGVSHFKGSILSMPAGNYHASLVKSGVELARFPIAEGGCFELKAESRQAGLNTPELQLDIIQEGRHIGTFLLKRRGKGDFYTPAVELSEEIKGVDFNLLTRPLEEKPGLLKKAEETVTKALSAKKDWNDFSERLHGLSADLFWQDRGVFYGSFHILARFSAIAAKRTGAERSLANFLDLIELPLLKEADAGRLGGVAAAWIAAVKDNAPAKNLSLRTEQSAKVLSMISEKAPGVEIKPVVLAFCASLLEKARNVPVFSDAFTDKAPDKIKEGLFFGRGSKEKKRILAELEAARRAIEAAPEKPGPGAYKPFFHLLEPGRPLLRLLDDAGMVEDFFEQALTGQSSPVFINLLFELLSLLEGKTLSGRARQTVVTGTIQFAGRLIDEGRTDLCAALIEKTGAISLYKRGMDIQKDVVMAPEMASRIFASGDTRLQALYNDILKRIFVPPPAINGYSAETWAEKANPLHLDLLGRFLDVLGSVPPGKADELEDVKAHLVANLFLSGVFIPDDRLFQRRVSAYLNSSAMRGQKGFSLLNFMLLKRLPVYFNEVGATNRIRDYTTKIDSWGNDPVLYFLRKQVHVNASSNNIPLAEGIIRSWAAKEPAFIEALVPADVFMNFDSKKLLDSYHSVLKPVFLALDVMDGGGEGNISFERLLGIPEKRLKEEIEKEKDASDEARDKVLFLCRIYQEIWRKYSTRGGSSFSSAAKQSLSLSEQLDGLEEAAQKLAACKAKILSPEKTTPRESLYFKRHIAFGIPSVLGAYHEEKFDALSEFLRLGERVRVTLEGVISGIELASPETAAPQDFNLWVKALVLANRILDAHGLGNFQTDEFCAVIAALGPQPGQVLDIIRMWHKEIMWAVESFGRQFTAPLGEALKAAVEGFLANAGALPGYLMNLDPSEKYFAEKASDIVIRNMMTDIPGFTETDRLLSAVAGRLASFFYPETAPAQKQKPAPGRKKAKADFRMLDELSDERTMELALALGGKAKNLVYLLNRGFYIPAGAVLPAWHTWDFDEYARTGGLMAALKGAVSKIEEKTGREKTFGGGAHPLFLSVRSGSYISMPGILVSILYCGMNEETVLAFARETADPLLAWGSYRIFLEHFGTTVLGLKQEFFDLIKDDFMGKNERRQADAPRMKKLTSLYLERIGAMGHEVPDDVYEQLSLSVRAVYGSWFSEKAAQFIRLTGMSPAWGTAVLLMQMVSGNRPGAGSSVFFTRDPATMEKEVYGETKAEATGDEIVGGAAAAGGAVSISSLAHNDPELYHLHAELARRIEDALGGLPQEVEATYTSKNETGARKIYIIQSRRMEFSSFDIRHGKRFDAICRMESRVIGRGIGVHGGALSGAASFSVSLDAIRALREKTGLPVILLRRTASTNDVSLMAEVGGIIAAAGGATSHASVLAQKFNLTAVVGCRDLNFVSCGQKGICALFGETIIGEGDPISMDGQTGLIFSGACPPQ